MWPLSLGRGRPMLVGAGLAAAGELVGDKLPNSPSRLAPAPLVGRLAFGGVYGALVALDGRRPWPLGAALGASAAAAGAYLGYHTRAALGRRTGVPDPVWAVLEDALALTLGTISARSEPPEPGATAPTT